MVTSADGKFTYGCNYKANVDDPSGPHCGVHSDKAVARRRDAYDLRYKEERRRSHIGYEHGMQRQYAQTAMLALRDEGRFTAKNHNGTDACLLCLQLLHEQACEVGRWLDAMVESPGPEG